MIKLGIIGFGRMGITHYSIINSHSDVEIAAVADTSKIMLSILKKYIPHLKVYNDYKKLMDEANPDAIIVCTPPNLHYPIIKYAYAKRIHVFCEKPFTADLSQALELSNLYNNSGLVNQVGYANRYRDVFIKVKQLIQDGLIGQLLHFKSEMFSCTITKKSDGSSWRDNKANGGGVIYEMASHLLDLNNYFFGHPDKVIGTARRKIFSRNVDDLVTSTFVFNNGLSGTLYVNWSEESYRKPMIIIEAFGTKGKIVTDFYGYKVFLTHENKELGLRNGWNTFTLPSVFIPVPFYVRGNEFTSQLYHFADLVAGKGTSSNCTFADAAQTHVIIEKMFQDTILD